MALDGRGDVEGQGECRSAVFAGNYGPVPAFDGIEKSLNFQAERFSGGDGWLGQLESRSLWKVSGAVEQGCSFGADGGRGQGRLNQQNLLAGIVDRDVLVRLEEAELADAFSTDTAGGEIGDAAGFELNADVGDVGFWRKDREPDSTDFAHGRLREGEDNVEIMDHKVEDDVHVEGARSENAKPVGLKEHGFVEVGDEGGDGGIEALEMADLENKVTAPGAGNQAVRLGQRARDWLFDQGMNAGIKHGSCNGGVSAGWGADGRGIQFEPAGMVGGQAFVC